MGSIGLLLSLLVFAGAVMILKGRRAVLGSAIVIACSFLSLPFTLGGLIGGMIFGLIGGLFGYAQTKPDYTRT
jgi:O-antigen ligase